MNYIGDFLTGSTVNIFFTTNDAAGAAVAPSSAFEVADVRLYKGSSATERTSQSGWTMTSPFDSITGLHVLAIDLSDNTDAGFYAAGNDYTAVLSPDETVDGQTIAAVLAQFSIENRSLKTILGADNKALISTDAQDLSTTLDVRTKTVTAGAITAAAIATGAIDADATAADFLAEINAEVDTALADVNLDHLVGTATGIPAVVAGTYLDQIMDDGTETYDRATDSLQAQRDADPTVRVYPGFSI